MRRQTYWINFCRTKFPRSLQNGDLLDQALDVNSLRLSRGVEDENSVAVRIDNRAVSSKVIGHYTAGNGLRIVARALAKEPPALGDEVGRAVVLLRLLGGDLASPNHHLLHVHFAAARAAGAGQFLASINHRKKLEIM